MRVLLVDVDSHNLPNLALMQLSGYHKSIGDEVGFDVSNPDLVYISCIFSKNASVARGISTLYPDSEVIIGGSGVDLHSMLPEAAQKIIPDYSLYPDYNFDLGFTTRGCIRHCSFCVVPEKEGKFQRWQHVSDFHLEGHKKVVLLDNNVYADRDWFFDNTDFIIKNNLVVDIVQGMDIRIIDSEIASRLADLRHDKNIRFAWDNLKDEERVFSGIDICKDAGIPPEKLSFYVLVGFNSTFSEDLYRVNKLRDAGVLAFVMQYSSNANTRRLARWANRRWLYCSVPFSEYNPSFRKVRK